MINEMLLREFASTLLIFLFRKIIKSCYKSPNLIRKQEAKEEKQQMITLQQKRWIPATKPLTFILPSVTLPSNYGAAECAGGVRDSRAKKNQNKKTSSPDRAVSRYAGADTSWHVGLLRETFDTFQGTSCFCYARRTV